MALPVRRHARNIARRDPFEELERTRSNLWSLLEMPFAGFEPLARFGDGHVALADLTETDGEFVLEVELPGIDKNDIDIEVEGRRIIVTAERKEVEREGTLRRKTRVTGSLCHEVLLPADIDDDKIDATLEQGVLTLTLPKTEGSKRHKIDVH